MAQTAPLSDFRDEIVYKPRPSNGRVWVLGIGFGTFALMTLPFLPALGAISLFVIIPFVILAIFVSAPIIIVGLFAPRMRYVLTGDQLILEMKPLMNDRIDIDSIETIQRRDLKTSPLASFRFPGLAVFDVDYRDANRVRMCATAAATDILLIETDRNKRYGITPEDPEGFINALLARASGSIKHLPAEIADPVVNE